jgi:endonuclease/exonuclease/phosphatase (EEP) superfamily protein YafD
MANHPSGKDIQTEWPEGAAAARPSSSFRRAWWWSSYWVAWAIVIALVAVAALRLFRHDAAFPLVWLNSFARYIYLPAYACAAWAAWQRRWVLLAAGLSVVVCHLAWMAPDFIRDRRFDPPTSAAAADTSPTLRIFFANVAADNDQRESLLSEIAAANPDVIVLVEFAWPWHIAFKSSPIMAPYKFGSGWMQSHIGSVNVFSKLPLQMEKQDWISGRAVQTVELEMGGHSIRLIGLHAPRPIGTPKYNYRGYWDHLLPMLIAEQGPVVIVGDCNATEHSLVYKRLTAERLRSAHDDRGRGYAGTWPNGTLWLPPIRIDQAFLSPEIECVQIAEGVGLGSDHKPLILDVRLRGNEGTRPVPASG